MSILKNIDAFRAKMVRILNAFFLTDCSYC